MSEFRLTPSLLCRDFIMHLARAFGPVEFSDEPASIGGSVHQKHIGTYLSPAELVAPLDDLSCRVLVPCAEKLAECLKRSGVAVVFHLGLPEHARLDGVHCSVHRFEGFSVRCLLQEPDYWPAVPLSETGKYYVRFDVLYREAAQSVAA